MNFVERMRRSLDRGETDSVLRQLVEHAAMLEKRVEAIENELGIVCDGGVGPSLGQRVDRLEGLVGDR